MVYYGLYCEWIEAHPDAERPDYFVGANDLTPEDHVRIQAVAQEYIDSSISKTVNAPNSHTVEDVKKLYMMSYDMGLKGVTYFRDGSRLGVLQREEKKEEINWFLVESPIFDGFFDNSNRDEIEGDLLFGFVFDNVRDFLQFDRWWLEEFG